MVDIDGIVEAEKWLLTGQVKDYDGHFDKR